MTKPVIHTASIIYGSRDGRTHDIIEVLEHRLEDAGIEILDMIDLSGIFPEGIIDPRDIPHHLFTARGDIAIVIGGDGTVLRALLGIKDKETPLLTIGLGEKNFMSSTTPSNLERHIEDLLKNRFYIRKEMRLEVEIGGLKTPPILNEVSYHSSNIGKTIKPIVQLYTKGRAHTLWSVKSDGVLVATPIGSTAYSYAAGGPAVDTDLEVMIITPLTPISKIPSYVVSTRHTVVLTADKSRSNPAVILDGQIATDVDWDTPVKVYRSDLYAQFIVFNKDMNITRMVKVASER